MTAARLIRWSEHAVLAIVAVLTLAAVGFEIAKVIERQTVVIADILLLFLYTEVLSMVAVYMESRRLPFVYPVLIASTALARLIVLQGKDMAPENVLYEAVAIAVLAVAMILMRLADSMRFLRLLGRRTLRQRRDDWPDGG